MGELCPCGKEDCGDGGPAVVCGVLLRKTTIKKKLLRKKKHIIFHSRSFPKETSVISKSCVLLELSRARAILNKYKQMRTLYNTWVSGCILK